MTDYSKMSDYEINGRVAKVTRKIGDTTQARGKTFIHEHEDVGEFKNICIGWKEYDPCNNPADAWPIIVKHGISLTHDYGEWESEACLDLPVGAHGTDELCSVGGIDKNPLRAAMIAFLLLKESEKCSS